MDYNQERKAKDMRTFIEYNMPNYAERVSFQSDYTKAVDKAKKYGLSQAIFFPSKPKTSSVVKFLSTEFRRRLLMIEVVPTTKNEPIMKDFGLTTDDLPALIIVDESGEKTKYEGGDFTRRKLERFLSDHAKNEPVYKPVGEEQQDQDGSGDEKKKEQVHTVF